MKNTSKLIGLVLALIVVILAIFLVTKFNSHESARVATVKSSVRTSQTTSSSSRKTIKKDNKSSQTSSSVASNEENDNQASAVAPKASSQEQAQSGATDGGQVAEATTPASQVEGGRGAWTATSGTLTLDAETPVYAAPDKDSGAVSKLPTGDVDWDKYEILPDGNWYSFVKDGQRYYISYSDVGH